MVFKIYKTTLKFWICGRSRQNRNKNSLSVNFLNDIANTSPYSSTDGVNKFYNFFEKTGDIFDTVVCVHAKGLQMK